MGWLIAFAFVSGLAALVAKDRERFRLRVALDTEKAAHEATRRERDALRADVARGASECEELRNDLAEVRALRAGGPFRSS